MDTAISTLPRRELAMWCASGLAIAIAPVAAASLAKDADRGEMAFDLWKATRQAINAAPLDDADNGNDATRWNIVDRLEVAILADKTPTARAAERQLWLALTHETSVHADDIACINEDLAHFEKQGAALDWNVRLLVASIATLRRAQGRA